MSTGRVQLALFGESNVGKTHYGGQLLSRIEAENCALKMKAPPSDLTPFDEVRTQLNDGLPASHTPSSVYRESVWQVTAHQGQSFELTWPDYGGEQVRQLIDARRIVPQWWERIQSSNGWILMIRPKLAKQDADIFSKPLGDIRRPDVDTDAKPQRSSQARIVELLQMMVHAYQVQASTVPPPLLILMSCWDELKLAQDIVPAEELGRRFPLVSSYINNRWGNKRVEVFGLSALGTALDIDKANEDFINQGPEQFGYVVTPDGLHTDDLTLPLLRLAAMAGEE